MDIQELYNLIESHLDNEICASQSKMKRVKLPIPKEYGGGVATGSTYEDAVKNLINRVQNQIKMEVKGPIFKECWTKWIELKEGQHKSASTISNYKWIAEHYILPYFGDKHIDSITADDIQKYFNSIMDLSASVSTQSKAILSGIFDRAIRMNDIHRNPMLYKYERSRKTGNKVILQDEDLLRVINQLDKLKATGDGRDYLYFNFLCLTSLRRGEILGLRWEDIDFNTDEIHVRNNITFPNGQNNPVICSPKDNSFGIIYLNSELKVNIKPYINNNYILPYDSNNTSKPMTRSMFTKMWNRCDKILDLRGATSHSFRASYATMMNAHCEHIDPKVLQGVLRHKTPDLAIKVYTKENNNKTRKAEIEYDRWLANNLA